MENKELPQEVILTLLTIPTVKQIVREELNLFFFENPGLASKPSSQVWFNLKELCAYLPEDPAEQTVYTWVSNRAIPVHKKGKKLYFLKSEIDEWLKSGRKKTKTELAAEAVSSVSKKKKGTGNA